jgi:hypothetical protein
MATDTITVDCLAYLGTQHMTHTSCCASHTHHAHIMRTHRHTRAHMTHEATGEAGAGVGVCVYVYTETHRLGILTVNHRSNCQYVYAQALHSCLFIRHVSTPTDHLYTVA